MSTIRIITLAAAVALNACRVNSSFSKLSDKVQRELTPPALPTATGKEEPANMPATAAAGPQVYKIDGATIQQMAEEKEITHVYVYGSFCKPCVAELPAIMQLHKANPAVGLVMVTPESWVALNRIKSFLTARQIAFPTYILDAAKYGDEFNGVKRYWKLMNELCPGYSGRSGFPTHLLLNRQHKVLYATAGAGRFNESVLDSVWRANR